MQAMRSIHQKSSANATKNIAVLRKYVCTEQRHSLFELIFMTLKLSKFIIPYVVVNVS